MNKRFLRRSGCRSLAMLISVLWVSEAVMASVARSQQLSQATQTSSPGVDKTNGTAKSSTQREERPASQTSPSEKPEAEVQVLIAEVMVKGANSELDKLVLKSVRTRPKAVITRSQLQEDTNTIFATGYFSEVKAEPSDTPRGVRVTFIVQQNPMLKQVKIRVNPANNKLKIVPESVIQNTFKDRYQKTINWAELRQSIAQLNEWYAQNGQPTTSILVKPPEISSDGIVTLTAQEEAPVVQENGVIKDIQVKFITEGNEAKNQNNATAVGKTPTKMILQQMETQVGQPLNESILKKDIEVLRGLDFFNSIEVSAQPSDNSQNIILTLNVIENDFADKAAEIFKYQNNVVTYSRQGNVQKAADSWKIIANIYDENDKKEQAIAFYYKALEIHKNNGQELQVAVLFNRIGNIYSEAKKYDYDKAVENYLSALKIYQEKKELLGQAIALYNLGNIYQKQSQYQQATDYYNQALNLFKVLKKPVWEGVTLSSLALIKFYSGEKEGALDLSNQALPLLKIALSTQTSCFKNNAERLPETGEKGGNLSYGFEIKSRSGLMSSVDIQLGMNSVQNCSNDFSRLFQMIINFNNSAFYLSTGDYQQAINTYDVGIKQFSLLLKKGLTDPDLRRTEIGSNNIDVPRLFENMIDFGTFTLLFHIYTSASEQGSSSLFKEQALKKMSEVVSSSTSIFKDLNLNSSEIPPYIRSLVQLMLPLLPLMFTNSQDSSEVINPVIQTDFFGKIAALVPEGSNIPDISYIFEMTNFISISTLEGKAENEFKKGNFKDATSLYQQAVAKIDNQKFSGCINMEPAIAQLQEKAKNNKQLQKTINQAEIDTSWCLGEFAQDIKQRLLNEIGKIYALQNERQSAIDAYHQALRIARSIKNAKRSRQLEAATLLLQGSVYTDAKQYQTAFESFDQALNRYRTNEDILGEAETYFNVATAERKRGNLLQAKTKIESALEMIESEKGQQSNQQSKEAETFKVNGEERVISSATGLYKKYIDLADYLSSKQEYYDFYIDLLMQIHQKQPAAGYDVLAFQSSERSRARSLRAMFNRAALSSKNKANLTNSNSLEIAKVPSLQEIQSNLLDQDTILLEYALGEERSYLWAITQNSIQTFALPKRSEIESKAKAFTQLISSPSFRLGDRGSISLAPIPGSINANVATELSQILLSPVADKLGNKRLIIVGDGALQYLPFAALPKPGISGKDTVPLIVDHEIVGLPSASTLIALQQNRRDRQKISKTLALFADPVFSREDERFKVLGISSLDGNSFNLPPLYKRLPGTRKEAEQILPLVPTSERLTKLDFDADYQTATSSEMSAYRILHFATHGILDTQRPERSGIVLSFANDRGEFQRSLLSTPNIFNLNLNSDLVVLSGCETGLGKEMKGEGLIGLTGGLMYAGSKSVVSSLWKIDDAGTASVMTNFYVKMIKDGLPPAAALRAAQIEAWKSQQWQAPYYWAAFVHQGNWK
jgi:CHAT domain-containing protein